MFLQPVSSVLPEYTLSNPEDHNKNIQKGNLNYLVIFVLIHHLNVVTGFLIRQYYIIFVFFESRIFIL